ncbi:hypothetical protein [Propionibacterium cyclohexanicum]|nr:hypothetical protein [Propionibacterium cyclohexanicum]
MIAMRRPSGRPSREELRGLQAALGHRAAALAWGRGQELLAVATRGHLAVAERGTWRVIAWDDILSGAWREDDATLRWMLIDGSGRTIQLENSGELPGVFMERVQASILVQERVPVLGGRGEIIVSGRRNPTGGGELRWMVQPLGSTDLSDPRVQQVAIAETEHLRREYEP